MAESPARYLVVVHPGSLGDVVLSLHALRALKRAYPGHALLFLSKGEVGEVLRDCGEVDRLRSLEGPALTGLLTGAEGVDHGLREVLSACDVAVCWMGDSGHVLRSTFEVLGVPLVIVQSPHAHEYDGLHQADRFLATIRQVTAGVAVSPETLRVPPQMAASGAQRLGRAGADASRRLVILHPGSGSRHKCADASLFVETMSWIESHHAHPLLLGGPADEDQVGRLVDTCPHRPPVLEHLNLHEAVGALQTADLFIGHDSGMTHLAAAVGVPTLALFGPTEVSRWVPRGEHVVTLSGASCRCRDWDAVERCEAKPCLQIPIQQIFSACQRLLHGRVRKPRELNAAPSSCYE